VEIGTEGSVKNMQCRKKQEQEQRVGVGDGEWIAVDTGSRVMHTTHDGLRVKNKEENRWNINRC
jgi:hypothetical protein